MGHSKLPVSLNNWLLLIIALLVLSGCQSENNYRAPVSEIGQPALAVPRSTVNLGGGPSHRVNEGETLYAIAWMYDLNFSALAQANNIAQPYVIFPGQELSLDVDQVAILPTQERISSSSTNTTVNQNSIGNAQSRAAGSANPLLRWVWPANGRVISNFSSSDTAKGIDIVGTAGDPIYAAEAGEVVYAGNALLRYGELIIIKHNDQFLSAYAHNDRLYVSEGDHVTRGQEIAGLGSTGIDREMLHFEIRLAGQPVDPAAYLPPR
jgi:lipoprotein NlpD